MAWRCQIALAMRGAKNYIGAMMMTALKNTLRAALALAALLALSIPATAQSGASAELDLSTYRNGDSALRLGHVNAAFQLFQLSCEAGDAGDCRQLGEMHRKGWATDQDFELAGEFYDKACTLGDDAACMQLGYMLFRGQGLEQDYARARRLYDRACDLGNTDGCAGLGNMMYIALGGPMDRMEGAALLRRACRAEDFDEEAYACRQVRGYGISRQEDRLRPFEDGFRPF